MEKSTSLKKWLEAVDKKDETRLAIYEEDYKDEIAQYKELKANRLNLLSRLKLRIRFTTTLPCSSLATTIRATLSANVGLVK